MPETQGGALCDPKTFEKLRKELGSFTVTDVFPMAHHPWGDDNGKGELVPRRRVLPVYPASWNPGNVGEDQIPWFVLFQSMEERLNQIVGVLARLSAGEKVVLPSSVPLQISEKGLSFESDCPYVPGQFLFLLMDLPVFPPVEIQVKARVLAVRDAHSGNSPPRYTVLALFEDLSPRLCDQLVQYMVVRQRESIHSNSR
ncbi:MAG: PilZ domain-containing protein [Leptospirales bacterium]